MYVNDRLLAHHNKPARASLRGLARNSRSAALLRRPVDEHLQEIRSDLEYRRYWSDEEFDARVGDPDPEERIGLAEARHLHGSSE